MFARKMGRRILILRSYRDGRGRVCQARLGHCFDGPGLEQLLGAIEKLYPGVEVARLRERAFEKLGELGPARPAENRSEKVSRAARALVTLLAECPEMGPESPELDVLRTRLQKLEGLDGLARVRSLRSRYSLRRRCFERIEAPDYLDGLDRAADQLLQQGRLLEGLQVLSEGVRAQPTSVRRLNYGALLQRLGRLPEAADQYSRTGPELPSKHYNLAAVEWLHGRPQQALEHVCRGFVRDPEFEQTRQGDGSYWSRFGDLWPEEGKGFFKRVGAEMLVRRRVRQCREGGVRARRLVSSLSLKWFLPKVLGL